MDLGHWIRGKGRLDVQDAVCWALRLARALAELHGRGRAHGRICPEAIMTRGPGRREPAMLLEPSKVAPQPAYQSADRAAGGLPSPADDVWAAGVTLYFALAGVVPFRGESASQIRERIEWAPPKQLSKHGVDARRVQRVLDRLFAPYRVERIVTAHDLQVVLTKCLSSKQKLLPIAVPESTFIASHHLALESSYPPPPDEPTSIEVREVPSETSGAEVLEAWLDDVAESTRDPEELAHWLREEEVPPSGHAVAELVAEVERSTEHEQPAPPSEGRGAPPSSRPLVLPLEEASDQTASSTLAEARATMVPSMRRSRTPRWLPWLGGALALAIVYALFGPRPTRTPKPAPAQSASAPRPAVTSSAVSTAAAPAPAGSSQAARDACMAQLFAVGTFDGDPPSFEPICRADDPRDGAQTVKTMVVEAGQGRGVTQGMVEWSRLGWYELAAFSILRGRCCDSELQLPKGKPFNLCDVGAALEQIHQAARAKDRHRLGKSVDGYRRAARCVARLALSGLFGQTAHPTPQQLEMMQKTMMRLRK